MSYKIDFEKARHGPFAGVIFGDKMSINGNIECHLTQILYLLNELTDGTWRSFTEVELNRYIENDIDVYLAWPNGDKFVEKFTKFVRIFVQEYCIKI